jgi:hypothetical protein
MALQKQGNKRRLAAGRQPASEALAGGLSSGAADYEDALAEFRDEEASGPGTALVSEFVAAGAMSETEPEIILDAAESAIEPVPVFEAAIEPVPVFEAAIEPVPVFEAQPEAALPVEPAPPVVLAAEVVVGDSIAAKVVVSSADGATATSAAVWGVGWPGKSLEVWNENATAVIDLASKLAKAKSLSDIVTLQSRFANERLESFMRLSSELAIFPKFFLAA